MGTLDDAWATVVAKVRQLADLKAFPLWTAGETWVTASFDRGDRGILPHDGSWMAGDLPALLWFAATSDAATSPGDGSLRVRAMEWSRRLENRARITSFASVSHMFYRGAAIPLEVHRAEGLLPMLTAAAETVSNRFRRIGYMKSFGEPADSGYPFTTIDDVINLCLPLWYAQQTGDARLADEVNRAAALIGDALVRPDGSTIQVLLFDDAGRPSGVETYQGYSPKGCWSRGLAWGIYGYAVLYGLSHEPLHLELAQAMAAFWMDRVQDDPSPLWDFGIPAGEPRIRDSFAASLAHAGLLEVASSSDDSRAGEVKSYVEAMVTRLSEDYVLNHHGLGILRGAALDVPHDHGVGENSAVIVGDSYYAETLWRLRTGRPTGPCCPVWTPERRARSDVRPDDIRGARG